MEWFIIVILTIVLIIKVKRDKEDKEPPQTTNSNYHNEEIEQGLAEVNVEIEEIEYIKSAYVHKWMFTQNEKRAYYKLNDIARRHDLIVFAKVRLFDLVTPQRYHPKYKTNLYKIQAKHVDFVLTKSNLVAKYIIELDDNSHNAPDRKERDKFVDTVLTSCGYKVLHTREITEEQILELISQERPSGT